MSVVVEDEVGLLLDAEVKWKTALSVVDRCSRDAQVWGVKVVSCEAKQARHALSY